MFWLAFFLVLIFVCLLDGLGILDWAVGSRLWGSPSSGLSFSVMLDKLAVSFAFMLLCCVLLALYYSWFYASSVILVPLMSGFGIVTLILAFSANLITSLVFWEYLGLFSILLILFYANVVSLRAALITLAFSRFGDASLFVLLAWSYYMWGIHSWQVFLSLLLIVVSKSAVYPMCSWLLEAMRAPTPVSSLVHSSTLVAAGVWFLLRYSLSFSDDVRFILCLFCFISVLVSGACAMCNKDLKKTVALSTCNNVSWCLIFDLLGGFYLALIQLLVHGACKCYLFMSAGDLMRSSGGSQDASGSWGFGYSGLWSVVSKAILVSALGGLPFMGVFYTKHCLVFGNAFFAFNLFVALGLVGGLWLTYTYCFRLFVLLVVTRSPGVSFGNYQDFLLSGVFGVVSTVLGWLGAVLAPVSWVVAVWQGCVFFLFQLLGMFFSFLMGEVIRIKFPRLYALSKGVYGNDFLVLLVYYCFDAFCEWCLDVVYRWEMSVSRSIIGGVLKSLVVSVYGAVLLLGVLALSVVVFVLVLYVFGGW
uniref:NADH:ubiquinone reductase (H(+)-translocating) n=1 Tax=Tamerlania zarudnyi TaxID=138578 RepID=A0A894JSH5_9TREM|nr:NADH dehydrogenase subunit 5 [Tamerlania zarudnyi]QRV61250.1 NADH dehydrogenase subunit 5 [Tamerlania zarudnyi]